MYMIGIPTGTVYSPSIRPQVSAMLIQVVPVRTYVVAEMQMHILCMHGSRNLRLKVYGTSSIMHTVGLY